MQSSMATTDVSLKGVKLNKSSGKYYFEARIPGHHGVKPEKTEKSKIRFYCTKIKSLEEGALCYDILQLYNESGRIGEKRKAAGKLNYPAYSKTLQLKRLRTDFNIRDHKDYAMDTILGQAQAAAKNLRESVKCSTPVVGSPSPSNRSSSHRNVHGKPLVAKQDLSGACTNQLNFQEISNLSHHCCLSYTLKLMETEKLESLVADINEDSGYISVPKPCRDKFTYCMARFKQLMAIDEKIPGMLEEAEQGYKSEDSKCSELRKLLKDHNMKVIGSVMDDGNESSGRERASEDERPPRVLEDCPSEEQNESAVFALDSEVYGLPGNPLVDDRPFGTDTATPPAEIGVSQRDLLHESDKVADENVVICETFLVDSPDNIDFRREEENRCLPEMRNGSNPEMPISQWSSDDWTDFLLYQESCHEDPDSLIPPRVISTDRLFVQP